MKNNNLPGLPQEKMVEQCTERLDCFLPRCESMSKKETREFSANEEELQAILDAVPIMIVQFDSEGNYQFANAAYLNWLNKKPEDIKGRHLSEIVGPKAFRIVEPYLKSAYSGESNQFESVIEYPNLPKKFLHIAYRPQYNFERKIVGVTTLITDLTETREKEKALEESEQVFKTMFELSGIGKAEVDAQTYRFLRVNKHFCEMTGYSREELLTKRFSDITFPEDSNEEENYYRTIKQSDTNDWSYEKRYVRKDGRTLWVLVKGTVIRDAGGSPIKSLATVQDVTEQRIGHEREKFLSEASKVLSSSLDHQKVLNSIGKLAVPSLCDCFIVDLLGYSEKVERLIVSVTNPAHKELAELAKKYSPSSRQPNQPALKALKIGKSVLVSDMAKADLREFSQNAEHFNILTSVKPKSLLAVPLVTRKRIVGVITLVTTADSGRTFIEKDISFIEDLASRVAIAIDNSRLFSNAQDAITARDEFLSIASHELKTPLTSIQLQTHIIKRLLTLKGEKEAFAVERMKKFIDLAHKQVDRLAALVNDMLDISRIATGKLTIQPEKFDINDLIREVVERMAPLLEQSKCPVVIEDCDCAVGTWDRFRIEQVISNLLSNAAKYGAGKPINIQCISNARGIEIRVKDQGRGIAKEDQDRIFQRFERAISATEISGLGLGLFIVREILKMHGGSISVDSEVGKGSTFIVKLPFRLKAQVA